MKIGLIKEEKLPVDKRVVLTPDQCKNIQETYSNTELVVQSCHNRCFTDEQYKSKGIKVVDNLNNCDVILGVKEIPIKLLLSNKTYFYFSHTIKKQPYNRELLKKMIEKKIAMVDYEVLKDHHGKRLIGFGRYAGIIGAYNALLTYGLKSGKYTLKPAYKCKDRFEMEEELSKLKLDNEKIVVTGTGRVGEGVIEILKKSDIKKTSINDFINKKYNKAVYVQLNTMDYNERKDGKKLNKEDFYSNPILYKSSFKKFAKDSDIFIAGHYYSEGSPYLFTRKDAKSSDFNFKVIADISCDIDGPVASTIRSSTIENPIYGYNPYTEKEVNFREEEAIAVMAVSNLPCELPRDASEDFGKVMVKKVIPALMNIENNTIISNATICRHGSLTSNFLYLEDYINSN
ncbi:MAG: alanine dehydrogenase [Flavobacteriales bacterium]|nr:alanine dehydrogenase [Flavobacteriales bacterium]|tara:strand:+ start:2777 stop:3979 length:1203 start_codon:yes stop_codon:yes gene_type:complete